MPGGWFRDRFAGSLHGFGDEPGGAESFDHRHEADAPSPRTNLGSADDAVLGVIAALHEDVGLQFDNQLERCWLIEDDDRIDGG